MKKITILGATGSIGVSALDVIDENPDKFKVYALAAGRNIRLLKKQIETFHPKVVSVQTKDHAIRLSDMLNRKHKVKILYGCEGLEEIASQPASDIVISAISGAAGLLPTLAALDAGKDVALANKETMVMAGAIVKKKAKQKHVKILPVDSEHSAIFQCLQGYSRENLHKIILTASGGPFLNYTKKELKKVKLSQALKHPRWKMGKKITIDSASLMNKGLEVIEAKWLFDLEIDNIDVVIHPQSIIHSMIEFSDGSVLAQMGIADMRIPIAYALSYPDRLGNNLPRLNLILAKNLEFYKPDFKKFPCLSLAYAAGDADGTLPSVLNAANEIAVSAFIEKKINFAKIPEIIERMLTLHVNIQEPSLEAILDADTWARRETEIIVERIRIKT